MNPQEVFEAIKDAIIKKEVVLKQRQFGVDYHDDSGRWLSHTEILQDPKIDNCQCALGALLLGEYTNNYFFDSAIEELIGINVTEQDSIMDGFDNWPFKSVKLYNVNEWYRVGFDIASWANENGILKEIECVG